jgi:hypothetical protein
MKTKLTMAAVIALLPALALAPAAFAQSSQDGYIQQGPSVLDQSREAPANDASEGAPPSDAPDVGAAGDTVGDTAAGGSSEELPFTGLDLGLIGVAGASLMLLGLGMRRLTRAPDSGLPPVSS